jgi:hypothetical protein
MSWWSLGGIGMNRNELPLRPACKRWRAAALRDAEPMGGGGPDPRPIGRIGA